MFLTTETLRHGGAGCYQILKSLNSRGGAETAEKTFFLFPCAATSALLRARINRGKIPLKTLAKMRKLRICTTERPFTAADSVALHDLVSNPPPERPRQMLKVKVRPQCPNLARGWSDDAGSASPNSARSLSGKYAIM